MYYYQLCHSFCFWHLLDQDEFFKNEIMKKLLIGICIVSIIISCGRRPDQSVTITKNGSEKEYLIHVNKVKDTLNPSVSDYAENFRFVPLETKEECMVSRGEIYVTEKYILVKKRRGDILQFDSNGKFIRILAKHGKGPTEYSRAGWTIDEENQIIYLADQAKTNYFLRFDLHTGEYLGDLKKAIPVGGTNIQYIEKNSLLFAPAGKTPDGRNSVYVYRQDLSGTILDIIEAPSDLRVVIGGKNLYMYNSIVRFEMSNESNIYTLSGNKLKSFIKFDFGTSKSDMKSVGSSKMTMDFETKSWVVLEKLTISEFVENAIYFDSKNYILDKKTGKTLYQGTIFLDPTNQRIYQRSQRSLSIQPNGIVSFVYQAVDLIDQAERAFDDDEFSGKYRNQLQDVISKISEEDNPIVIIGRLK